MAINQQNRTTAVSILQIGISRNTKCVLRTVFAETVTYVRTLTSYVSMDVLEGKLGSDNSMACNWHCT